MLELTELTKTYGSFTAVDHLTLDIADGELFGLLGPNGAGKSTTVSMISTILAPTSGSIRVNGIALDRKPRQIKALMGIVPQDLALYSSLSAADNLAFFGSLYGLGGRALRQRVDEVLEMIELTDKRNQDVDEFSGGMKRRVNLGIALMNRPKLLILDEPTVGIDPQSRVHILETVRRLNAEEGMTVIYTSHYMEEVEALCPRLAIVDHGRLIALGTKEELKAQSGALDELSVVCASEVGDALLERFGKVDGVFGVAREGHTIKLQVDPAQISALHLIERIQQEGAAIQDFQYAGVNLERIFIALTGKKLRE
ncbi:MAG: ABC transporter ATP-binding protein [Sporolactobacillus sp.]